MLSTTYFKLSKSALFRPLNSIFLPHSPVFHFSTKATKLTQTQLNTHFEDLIWTIGDDIKECKLKGAQKPKKMSKKWLNETVFQPKSKKKPFELELIFDVTKFGEIKLSKTIESESFNKSDIIHFVNDTYNENFTENEIKVIQEKVKEGNSKFWYIYWTKEFNIEEFKCWEELLNQSKTCQRKQLFGTSKQYFDSFYFVKNTLNSATIGLLCGS